MWFFVGCQANSSGEHTNVATDSDADGSSADVPDVVLDDGFGDADISLQGDTAAMDIEELPELSEWWVNPECPAIEPAYAIVFPPTMDVQWELESANASFASPVAFDVNEDCIRDILVGSGVEGPVEGSVDALDGATGELLWRGRTVGEVYSRAQLLQRFPGDSGLLISAGRWGTFAAHEISNGEEVWRFDVSSQPIPDRWNNFAIPQVIPDVDGDGVPDLVTTSGAVSKDAEEFEEREVNYLILVSGATGTLLRAEPMPDGRETYMSPVIWNRDQPWVVWGSGGETFSGSLWGCPLSDLAELERPMAATELATSSTTKGFMAPPALMDLNGDAREDLVVVAFDGRVLMLDGVSGELSWTWSVEGYESYSSPALGRFDDDLVPDVAVILNEGVWAEQYTATRMVVLSGVNGEELWSEDGTGVYAPSPVMVDLNADGVQEVIFVDPGPETSTIRLARFSEPASVELVTMVGTGLSSPWIDDVDYDGVLELIAVTAMVAQSPPTHRVHSFSLNARPSTGGWYGYLNRSGESRALP
jgi:hypothetical protein